MTEEHPREEDTARPLEYGETWTYESFLGAIPGVSVAPVTAVVLQVVAFETAVLAGAAYYGLWDAAFAGTIAVGVAGAGSAITLRMGRELRGLDLPEPYRRLAFGSRVEVVLSVLAYVAFLTYLIAVDPIGGTEPFLTALLGADPPAPAVFLALLVAWDVVYRIGTAWWASVTAVWRSWRYEADPAAVDAVRRADLWPVGFACLQLGLLPVVWAYPLLVVALLGHVTAVAVAAGASIALYRT